MAIEVPGFMCVQTNAQREKRIPSRVFVFVVIVVLRGDFFS